MLPVAAACYFWLTLSNSYAVLSNANAARYPGPSTFTVISNLIRPGSISVSYIHALARSYHHPQKKWLGPAHHALESNQAISPSLHQAQLHIVRRGDQHQPPLVPFLTIGLLNTFATTAARLTQYYSAGNCLRLFSVYRSNLQPWTAHRSIMPRARTGLTL